MDKTDSAQHKRCDLHQRVKQFALRIIRMYTRLPESAVASVIGKQVLPSGTSVGAHYHEAHRARSTAEFVSKLEVGIQELAETSYWLSLLVESETVAEPLLADLRNECSELEAIFTASVRTAKKSSNS